MKPAADFSAFIEHDLLPPIPYTVQVIKDITEIINEIPNYATLWIYIETALGLGLASKTLHVSSDFLWTFHCDCHGIKPPGHTQLN